MVSGPGSQQTISAEGSSVGTDGGFTPWTRPLTLGTDKAVYIEDNTFDYTGNDQAEDAIDAYSGARIVVRHNTFLSCTQGFHGTDTGGMRSPHSFEIYNNTYINNSSHTIHALTVRGGTGVIYNNTYGGSRTWYGVALQYYRAYSSQGGWRQCNGTVWQLGSTNLASEGSRTCSINGGVGFHNVNKETLGPWGGNYTTGLMALDFSAILVVISPVLLRTGFFSYLYLNERLISEQEHGPGAIQMMKHYGNIYRAGKKLV